MRTTRAPNIPMDSHIAEFDSLGIERIHDFPLYDNGMFYVIDRVADLSFVVCMHHEDGPQQMQTVDLDKYEAIRLADEYREAAIRTKEDA